MKIQNPKSLSGYNGEKVLICPYCKKDMPVEMKRMENNSFFPFCSQRCKFADLDKWFSGEYSIEQDLEELTDEQLDDLPEAENST